MIARYALSPMKELWSESAKYQRWLEVELAVVQAQAELGQISPEAAQIIKQKARLNPKRIQEIEAEIGHDLLSFVRSLEEEVGPEGRFLHLGLTSYDVVDTARSWAMRQAFDLLIPKLEELLKILKGRALEQKETLMVGRTHGMQAEPITFGLKLLLWYAELSRHLRRLQQAQQIVSVAKSLGRWAPTPMLTRASRGGYAPGWVCARRGSPTRACSATATLRRWPPWPSWVPHWRRWRRKFAIYTAARSPSCARARRIPPHPCPKNKTPAPPRPSLAWRGCCAPTCKRPSRTWSSGTSRT